MRLLLAALPNTLHARGKDGHIVAHAAAEAGSLDALQLVLQLAPELAAATDSNGSGPIHNASGSGQLAIVQYLLQLAPELAAAADRSSQTPLHYASRGGHLAVVDALLVHAPDTVHAMASNGRLPLHEACAGGHALVVSRLLEVAPATIAAVDVNDWTALHIAAAHGHADLVAQLLALTPPEAAQAVDSNNATPLLLAARANYKRTTADQAGHTAAVQHLLAAAPASLRVPDSRGDLPLHWAALANHAGAVRALLSAAPDTMMVRNAGGCIPLELAAAGPYDTRIEAAKLLLAACPAAAGLSVMADRSHLAAACAGAFVAAHLPLDDEQWEQLQHAYFEMPGSLAQALPAALEHSAAQARQLVCLLAYYEKACLHAFGLCLALLQRRLRVQLPGPVVGKLMALFNA